MEQQKDKKTPYFNMSEDISHISIVDSSIEENVVEASSQSQSLLCDISMNSGEKENVEARSQSQSLLRDLSMNTGENGNSEKMDGVEGFSEELFTPSPMPSRSVLEDLEKGADVPKVSSCQNVISVTDKLLQEAQKASRDKRASSSDTNSDIDELENEDSIRDEDDDVLENDDSIRNYVKNLETDADGLENENTNKEKVDDSEENDSEDIDESPSPDVDPPADSELLEEDEDNDMRRNAMDVNESNEQDEHESVEKEDTTTEDSMSLQTQLPVSKIRRIIKADAENKLVVTKEAIYIASIAAELFIANVTQQTAKITHATKKKTVSLAHLKSALAGSESFDFLEGCFQDIY